MSKKVLVDVDPQSLPLGPPPPYITIHSTNGERVILQGTLKKDGLIEVHLGEITTLQAKVNGYGLGDVRIDGSLPLPVKKMTIIVEAGKPPHYVLELLGY